jgi:hypothetical protein
VTAIVLAAICVLLAFVPVAQAAVWTALGTTRVFPATKPGTQHVAELTAAGGEYEGVIVGLRGSAQRHVVVTWAADSDPFLTTNAALDQVAFVPIRHPTTGTGAKPGLYPDPLLPRNFGQVLSVPAGSSSLYLLFHVPYGSQAGIYRGTLQVANGSEQVAVPVNLQVWSFGWQRLSVHTGFTVNFKTVGSNALATYAMLEQHGVTPLMPKAAPHVQANGGIGATAFASELRPYLASDGLDMSIARLPWLSWCPGFSWTFKPGNATLENYLTNVLRVYQENGWQNEAVAYPVDEPTSTAAEHRAEGLARTLHKASARLGFRAKFLLTDDPRPTSLGPLLPANKFLWNDIDIWCVRYYYFFGRVPVLRKLQAKGAQVWWYPYYDSSVAKLPNFVIDKSLADEQVWGWLMYQWNVDGMLYWNVDRWGNALSGAGRRDPYQDPLSFQYPDGRVANGEGSLIYPGYYPRYGLDDRDAPPASSLRLEALRDGFQDLEYLKLATRLCGAKFVRSVVKSITWYPYKIAYGHTFNFPKYVTSPAAYDAARVKLAKAIEQSMSAQPTTSGAGPAQRGGS